MARRTVLAENTAVFHGRAEAQVIGIAEASIASPLGLGRAIRAIPLVSLRSVELMLNQGIGGPCGVAAGPETYTA